MITPNGNVVTSVPARAKRPLYDWPELNPTRIDPAEPRTVTIWRGTAHEHTREKVMTLEGSPADVADWLEALARVIRKAAVRRWRHCVDCGIDTVRRDDYYMVHDHLWAAAGMEPAAGMLCTSCLELRLGRPLTSDDFTALVSPRWAKRRAAVLLAQIADAKAQIADAEARRRANHQTSPAGEKEQDQ